MRWTVLLILACLTAGCRSAQAPTGEVVDVRVQDQTAEGARVLVTVVIDNPNAFAMPIESVHYRLSVDGHDPFVFDRFQPLPALTPADEQTYRFAASVATGGQNILGRGYRFTGTFRYQPPSQTQRLLFETGLPNPTFVVTGQAELP